MKRTISIAMVLLIIATMMLTACSTSKATDETAVEEPAAEEAAPAEEETVVEPKVSSLTIWADETRAPIIEEIGKDFTAKYGVDIIVQEMGSGDIRDQLKVAGPAGEGPDIIVGAHDWLGELVTNGLLAEIDLGDKAGDFFGPAVDAFTYDGKLYGMPYATENLAFFRNVDLVPEAPTTWDEVAQISADLQAAGSVKYGYALQENDPYHFFPLMSSFGGYVFGRDANGSYDPSNVGIDSEGSIAAATWVDNMVKEGQMAAGIDYSTMHSMFENGQVAMIISGPWALTEIRDSGVHYAISNIPSGTTAGTPFLGVQGFMISSFSKDPLLAQTFLLEYIATEETMQAMYDANPRPSAYLPVREATEDADMIAFGEAGSNAVPMPAIPAMSAVWTAWGNAEALVFQQQQTPAEAFKNAAEQIRSAIAQ
jgi:maltose/maltodextrin transport system substrate-binding protein/arabinogalactan oligomer/maltooligosaccharide transport system substrate-binding protein